MWQKKKVCLVDRVGGEQVEFRSRNAPQHAEEDLPEGLFDQPRFCGFFRDLGGLR